MSTNINYWEQVLQAPTPAYQELFDAERDCIRKHVKPGMNVLDIGSGDGRNMKTILEMTEHVTGVDHDPMAVQDALKNFSGYSSVKLVVGDASKLPFGDETFDVVTFLMILPNLDTQKQIAFNEASRIVKKDGLVILSTFSETALDERMKVYKIVNVPIQRIEGTKVIFDKSLGANTSEQFSLEEIGIQAQNAGLKVVETQKVGKLAYVCVLRKV